MSGLGVSLRGLGLCSFDGGGGGGEPSGPWLLIFGSRLYVSLELGCWGGSSLAFSDMWAWYVGVLDTEAGLCYGGLLTSIGNPIELSQL